MRIIHSLVKKIAHLVSVRKGFFSALAVSIFGLTSQSVDFVYASTQPTDFLARTKNTSFPNGNCQCLIRGFRMDTI